MHHELIPSKDSDISNYSCIQAPYEEIAGIFCIWDIALIKYWFALMGTANISLTTRYRDKSAEAEHINKHET